MLWNPGSEFENDQVKPQKNLKPIRFRPMLSASDQKHSTNFQIGLTLIASNKKSSP